MTFHLLMMDQDELMNLVSIQDDHELGVTLYQEAKHSTTTRQSLLTVLSTLLGRVIIPTVSDASQASSTSSTALVSATRMQNLITFCTAQRQILGLAIERLSRMP
jgi:hypothetical protein